MKRRYLLLGSMVFMQLWARAQYARKDTTQQKLKKTEIELVYNQYLQDGIHSAITGGTGSERLRVYGPGLSIKKTSGRTAFNIKGGIDFISSVSTDRIDFVESSASRHDRRYYGNATLERKSKNKLLTVYGGIGSSIESDYLSIQSKLGFTKSSKSEMQTYSAEFQMFNDDLRWGRFNDGEFNPQFLIYPAEIDHIEWSDVYRRNTYNLKLGFKQILNARNVIGIYPEVTRQDGLLGTPFHRVYFPNDSVVVENLPNERWKGSLGIKLNSFVGGNVILKNSFNGYRDDFGIRGITIENETAVKLKSFVTLLFNARVYSQRGTRFFAPFQQNQIGQEFYTSDFDLSSFETYTAGVGMKYKPGKYISERRTFDALVLRYYFMRRTDGLRGHTITLAVKTSLDPKKRS